MLVRPARAEVALVDIVGPDGIKGGDVAGHAGHERCHQGREAQAEQPVGIVVRQQGRDGHVVVGRAVRRTGKEFARWSACRDRWRSCPGTITSSGKQHLGNRGDQGSPAGRGHGVGRHRPLHHQEVGTPVAEGQHETQAHASCRTTRPPSGWPRRCAGAAQMRTMASGGETLPLRHEPPVCCFSPVQPPTAIDPRKTSGRNPSTIMKNCSTSL